MAFLPAHVTGWAFSIGLVRFDWSGRSFLAEVIY
jgi:hypothetical protein